MSTELEDIIFSAIRKLDAAINVARRDRLRNAVRELFDGRKLGPVDETKTACSWCSGQGMVTMKQRAEWLAKYPELSTSEHSTTVYTPPKDGDAGA